MANVNSTSCQLCLGIRHRMLTWAIPHMAKLPPADREGALRRARETGFDTIEKVGALVGIALVTYLLRFDANQASEIALPIQYLTQFLAALPLLILSVGPFYLRCLRRGMDQEIERRQPAGRFEPLGRHRHD